MNFIYFILICSNHFDSYDWSLLMKRYVIPDIHATLLIIVYYNYIENNLKAQKPRMLCVLLEFASNSDINVMWTFAGNIPRDWLQNNF